MPDEFAELVEWSARQGYVDEDHAYLADPRRGEHCLVRMGVPYRGWDGYLTDPDRLWELGATGGEGSSLCLWLDDEGGQHVVHHGSGSGSVLFAVLPSAGAVLRLFAVGYEEPAWNSEWATPPEDDGSALTRYRTWLAERFGVSTPRTGVEALGLEEVSDQWTSSEGPSEDPFAQWLLRPGTTVAR